MLMLTIDEVIANSVIRMPDKLAHLNLLLISYDFPLSVVLHRLPYSKWDSGSNEEMDYCSRQTLLSTTTNDVLSSQIIEVLAQVSLELPAPLYIAYAVG